VVSRTDTLITLLIIPSIAQYVSILIGGIIGCLAYITYQGTYMVHYYKTRGWPEPEQRLEAALVGSFLLPIGLFIFGEQDKASRRCVKLTVLPFDAQPGQQSRTSPG
jgi:hypothetical protein